jgi:thioredoxin 2
MAITMTADYRIICDKCRAINRLPLSRLNDKPKCGKCRRLLFDGTLLELSDSNFQQLVGASSQPLLVLFWASWCGYCQKTLPDFKQAAMQLEPNYRLATLNTEANKLTAKRYSVNSLPTLFLFKSGNEVARQPGAMNVQQVCSWARSNLMRQ